MGYSGSLTYAVLLCAVLWEVQGKTSFIMSILHLLLIGIIVYVQLDSKAYNYYLDVTCNF